MIIELPSLHIFLVVRVWFYCKALSFVIYTMQTHSCHTILPGQFISSYLIFMDVVHLNSKGYQICLSLCYFFHDWNEHVLELLLTYCSYCTINEGLFFQSIDISLLLILPMIKQIQLVFLVFFAFIVEKRGNTS